MCGVEVIVHPDIIWTSPVHNTIGLVTHVATAPG